MEWLLFSKLSIQAFTQLVLSLMITIYLASVRDKSVPTKILVVFFSLFTLNIVPDLVQVSLNTSWSFQLSLFQIGGGMASMVALMQFAYWFPENRHLRESRLALGVASAAVVGSVAFAYLRFSTTQAGGGVSMPIGLVMMAIVLWIIGIFARKMIYHSRHAEHQGVWRHCCEPCGRPARALRAFAGLTLVWLLLSGAVVLEGLELLSASTLLHIMSGGTLVFLFAFALVYMNNATEPSSFSVKMVGFSLVLVLLTMGDMAGFVLQRFEEGYNRERLRELMLYRRTVAAGSFSSLPREIRFVDVHYLRDTQDQLFLQEKMASLGSLVAGVAHEINNPIGAVNSAVDVAGRCVERIYCAPGQLNQVFMNVLKNAVQALEGPGTVKIGTVEDEENIYVQIDDTGRGIPQQELDAIFDFGFRTDARVKLGAGLSTAYRIVQDHGGQIQIESQVGAGTQVQIALPKRDRRIAAA